MGVGEPEASIYGLSQPLFRACPRVKLRFSIIFASHARPSHHPKSSPNLFFFNSLPSKWGGGVGQPEPCTLGANDGSTRVPGAEKVTFSKVVPRPLGMLKQVFLAPFEPVVTHFNPWKIPKCLENGPFWVQREVKNASKTCFSKSDHRPFGVHKQVK